jgi:FAD/FMN-containing dehydrogenase
MSFKYGGFHDGCLEYELVTGDGRIVTCSPEKDPLVFGMIHGSYGTLGILTKLVFRLVPAQPFVHLEYRTLKTAQAFHDEMLARCKAGDYDFIDGIVHGPDCWVLCLGKFASTAPYTSSYRWLDIFYQSTRERRDDWLTTEDYCFRYDTECHWLTKTMPPLEWRAIRFLIGKRVLGSTNLIKWSKLLAPLLGLKKRPDVVVDVFIPSKRCGEFYRWYERDFAFWPLWVVPYRIPEKYPWLSKEHAERMDDDLFIDCAVYGKVNDDPRVDHSQTLEEKTFELDGIKTLISRNHYTRERFWQIYHRENYDTVKQRLDPRSVFSNLYEKFHRVE